MPAGRPHIEIDKGQFEKLCAFQTTLDELAGWFNCSPDTIERWCEREYGTNFAEVFKQNRGKGRASLRGKQWETAMKGDKTMLIWLGKQMLGQADKQDTNLTSNQQITFVDDITELNADTD